VRASDVSVSFDDAAREGIERRRYRDLNRRPEEAGLDRLAGGAATAAVGVARAGGVGVGVDARPCGAASTLRAVELAPPVSRDERAATPDVHVAAKTQDKRAFGYTVVGYALSIAGTVVSTPELRKTMFRLITGGLGPLLGGFTVPADALAVGRLAVSGVEVDGRLPLAGS